MKSKYLPEGTRAARAPRTKELEAKPAAACPAPNEITAYAAMEVSSM